MKKSILFVIDSLHCAGAEKSLVTLLSMLDYSKYNVDLQLFGYGGALEELLPKEVNLIKTISYMEFANKGIVEVMKKCDNLDNLKMLWARIKYSIGIRKSEFTNAQMARIFWNSTASVIESNPKQYDIAISYAQGIPTFYVAQKIKAKSKLAWVNVSYILKNEDKVFQNQYYKKFDKIVAVSKSTKEIFLNTFPEYENNIEVIYDINNPNMILEMANTGESYIDNFSGIRLLTIGRLDHQKGYDIAIEACKILKQKKINFKWYILGIGNMQQEIEKSILENNLQDVFILLGVKSNPYPYIKNCDIYVQTSRFEGFGLAIAEARMLNKPVVTTRFDAVYNQMIDDKNGLVVDMNGEAVSEGILKLIKDNELRTSIINYLKIEKKGNTEELEKFYQLIESY